VLRGGDGGRRRGDGEDDRAGRRPESERQRIDGRGGIERVDTVVLSGLGRKARPLLLFFFLPLLEQSYAAIVPPSRA
jgi:hypothetical protein